MKHVTKYQSKQEKVFSTLFLVMSLRKILETFIRFFPSFFNRKYVHTVACTVVFVGPAFVLFPAVPTKTMVHAVALTVFLPFLVKDPFV